MSQYKVRQPVWALLNRPEEEEPVLWPGVIRKLVQTGINTIDYEVTLIDQDEDIEAQMILLRKQEIRRFQTHTINEKTAPPSLIHAYNRAVKYNEQLETTKIDQQYLIRQQLWIHLGLQKPEQMNKFLWSLCQSKNFITLDERIIEALNNLSMEKKYVKKYWQFAFCKMLNFLVNEREIDPRSKLTLDNLRKRMKKLVVDTVIEDCN